jgi:hypothetical protein
MFEMPVIGAGGLYKEPFCDCRMAFYYFKNRTSVVVMILRYLAGRLALISLQH